MMNAIYFEEIGEAQKVLALASFEKPVPRAGEVLVKVLGSTINPADFLFIAGNYRFKPVYPQIAGLEGAGIVVANGDGADLPIGTLVAFLHKETWAEYAVVPTDQLFILPAGFPLEKAVQFALNPITAWGLLEAANVKAGEHLLLSAGNSVVADLTARLALLRGIKVIATVRNDKGMDGLKALGVIVINIKEENVEERVLTITNGEGVQCVLDPVGGVTGTQLLKCLGVNGKFIIYGKLDPEPAQFNYPTIQYRNLVISAFGVRGFILGLTAQQRTDMIKSLAGILGDPGFKLEVAASFTMDEFREAVRTAAEGGKAGKVIFNFKPRPDA